jgi:F-type H+-transporting ATPase subunit epsilon
MAATLKLEIVTPEAVTYSENVEFVTIPAVEGEMGIFPMHVPLMTQIVPGEISVRKDGQDYFLAVGEGFVEITGDHVAVLTDMAIKAARKHALTSS